MGIFGIVAAVVIPVAGLIVTIVLFVLGRKRKRIELFNEISARFRAAFSDSVAGLNDEKDAFWIVSKSKIDHDKAIEEFRWHLPAKRVAKFNRAVNEYRSLRDSAEPSFFQFVRAEATGKPTRDQRPFCVELLAAINKLLDFAKPIH
ncbi:MAG TPA: hypothetical protein VN776_02205 [Terracidiphilus sp.]|nr:hypothetical protein [Terracidiphilus sp.]